MARPTASKNTHAPNGNKFPLFKAIALVFLTLNSGTALYRSGNDFSSAAFIIVSYVDLVSLFVCLTIFEKTPKEPSTKSKRTALKVAIWSLATILTTMFTYRVANIMPLPMAVVIWSMAALTLGGGFYAFFVYNDPSETNDDIINSIHDSISSNKTDKI